jgi:hypothetical protein
MSNVNGVHALLAFLAQQARPVKQSGDLKVDVKQLERLLEESRLLNERLLKIERLLVASRSPSKEHVGTQKSIAAKPEGNWPAAGAVRDTINRQERQQAFGSWSLEETAGVDREPFSHRAMDAEQLTDPAKVPQVLIQKYIPTESDIAWAEMSANFGVRRNPPDFLRGSEEEFGSAVSNDERSRLIVIAIGIALLLFALFAVLD